MKLPTSFGREVTPPKAGGGSQEKREMGPFLVPPTPWQAVDRDGLLWRASAWELDDPTGLDLLLSRARDGWWFFYCQPKPDAHFAGRTTAEALAFVNEQVAKSQRASEV